MSCLILVAPWFEHKGEKEVVRKTGENVTLKCSAKGFPLNVEWKSKSGVVSCIGKFLVWTDYFTFVKLESTARSRLAFFIFIFMVEKILQPTNQQASH